MRKAPTFRSSPEPFPHAPYSCRQQNLRCPDFCPYYFCFPYPIEKTWVKFVRIWRANVPTFARTAYVSTPYDSDARSDDKSGTISVSNALSALTKSNQLRREEGKYRAAT